MKVRRAGEGGNLYIASFDDQEGQVVGSAYRSFIHWQYNETKRYPPLIDPALRRAYRRTEASIETVKVPYWLDEADKIVKHYIGELSVAGNLMSANRGNLFFDGVYAVGSTWQQVKVKRQFNTAKSLVEAFDVERQVFELLSEDLQPENFGVPGIQPE